MVLQGQKTFSFFNQFILHHTFSKFAIPPFKPPKEIKVCDVCKVSEQYVWRATLPVEKLPVFVYSRNSFRTPFKYVSVCSFSKSPKVYFLSSLHIHFQSFISKVFEEPVDKWRSVPSCSKPGENHNLLQLFYQDPKKWSFAFQHYIQLTMLQIHKTPVSSTKVKIMERSIHSAKSVLFLLLIQYIINLIYYRIPYIIFIYIIYILS